MTAQKLAGLLGGVGMTAVSAALFATLPLAVALIALPLL